MKAKEPASVEANILPEAFLVNRKGGSMEFRLKWSEHHLKRINSRWGQVIPATNPVSSQLERVGALVIADSILEYILETVDHSGDSVGRKLYVLKRTVSDFKDFIRKI